MTSASDPRSRRDLIATVSGGALFGALWGAAFPIVATERRPTIAVVGHRNAQIVVVDTSTTRTLILAGEPDAQLLETLPTIMTVFRQRIDLLVATPPMLADLAIDLRRRWRVRHAIALSGEAGASMPGSPTTAVTDGLDVTLDARTQMAIRMGHLGEWRTDAEGPRSRRWCLTLETPAGNVVIAPDIASLVTIAPPPSTLTIVPNAPAPEVLAVSPTAALAVNHDSETIGQGTPGGQALTRVYPRDVARFVITDGSLLLPEWTVLADSA